MIKIWEVDFTSFSGGGSDEPIDNVGTQDLPAPLGDVAKIDPMPGFTDRAGITYPDTGNFSHYRLDLDGVDNARLRQAYDRRSFVTWIYPFSTADNPGIFWSGSVDSSTSNEHTYLGFGASNQLQLKVNESIVFTDGSSTALSEWHSVILTVDRLKPESILYLDGVPVYSGTGTPDVITAGSRARLGDLGSSKRPLCHMAYAATYDNILTSEEIIAIYDGFLLDATNPNPFASIDGVVYDVDNVALAAADVVVYNNLSKEIEDTVVASPTGVYAANFPNAGEFSLYSTKPGVTGGRAASVTVSSGGVVTVNDDT